MEGILEELQPLIAAVLWPFCRIMAALASAPALGEMMVPMKVRALAALALAVVMQPGMPEIAPVDPISFRGMGVMAEQILIGGMLGYLFHLILSALMVLGTVVSSQMGLSMAQMNDPVSGTSSDAISSLLHVLFILLFFAVDGHLVLTQVLARSFHVWPVGSFGFDLEALKRLAFAVGWIFSVALMLALPVIFATMVVQVGMGFLNRVAPTLNLFALGFSITTVFGLLLLVLLIPSLPEHFSRMMTHVLDLLDRLVIAPAGTVPTSQVSSP
ncbi:MAG: flagellar biosynthetic protein FliR [Rhodanobacter sp.]